MRILSQDGMIDVPYEQTVINIDYINKNNIVANGVNCTDNNPYTVAIYSTEAKAKRAMEMLRFCYKEHVTEMIYHEGSCYIHPYFQFPADDELEG